MPELVLVVLAVPLVLVVLAVPLVLVVLAVPLVLVVLVVPPVLVVLVVPLVLVVLLSLPNENQATTWWPPKDRTQKQTPQDFNGKQTQKTR